MLDTKTLALAIGLGNLIFALLTTLYIRTVNVPNRALETWRWAKLTIGLGLVHNMLQSVAPNFLLPVVFGNIVLIFGFALEFAAYCKLLKRQGWEVPLLIYAVLVTLTLLVATHYATSDSLRLVVFNFATAIIYTALTWILLSASNGELIFSAVTATNAIGGVLLFARAARGLFFIPLVRYQNEGLAQAVYLIWYLSLMVNGFGFLLLAKQQDDRKLLQALDDLEQAEAQQRQLLAVASHEFRNPAAIIKASLGSLAILDAAIPPEIAKRLDKIRSASQRLNTLANRLITHDRLRGIAFKPKMQPCDLILLAHEVRAQYPPDTSLQLEVPATPVMVEADAVLLDVALHNLIDNALRYHAEPDVPVLVSLLTMAGEARIQVADRGPGIPDADKEHVFQNFYSDKGGIGDGLGLAIVHSIVHLHGGRVAVLDNQPHGAILEIHLPLPR